MSIIPRKFFCLLSVLSIFSAISSPVYANDQTVFGPKELKISRWHVHLSLHRFNVDDPGNRVIIITKNTPNKKIRGGFLLFNRRVIPLRAFLVGGDTVFEKDISLQSKNHMTVLLRGKPGASITIEVMKRSTIPPPVVTFSADPQSITLGESSTITWTTTNADIVSIDQGIGSVFTSGFLIISPQETTTYTLTAVGTGGTTTKGVTVTVNMPPTVEISADPKTIQVGESSMLSWTSTHADSCVIEPDIGIVDVNGSIQVSPTETTTYTITATGPGGTATDSVTVTVIYPITLTITSPSDGETISRPDIKVEGAITDTTGNETGITVNGVLAIVNGNQFVINHIPLKEGENTITATATDIDGNTAIASITIIAVTTGDYISLSSDTESGISPLETTLRVEGSFTFTEESTLTYDGPGEVEFLESTSENEYKVSMTTEGIYYFTAEVTDDESNTYTDTIAIVVISQAELDALLTAKWDGMNAALVQNDIDSAVSYFDDFSKEAYRAIFNALTSQQRLQITQEFSDIQFIRIMEHSAEYDIRTIKDGREYSFYMLFVRDEDGLWKIRSF